MKGKMAIIGDESVSVFVSVGMNVFVSDETNALQTLKKVAKDYAIIFVTDALAKILDEQIKEYNKEAYPIVLALPAENGSYAIDNMKRAMEKALGVDILFSQGE